jgi:hypothetical protein
MNQFVRCISSACLLFAISVTGAWAAENLHMRDGISFFHDLDQGFPILADKMDDVQVAQGKVTLIFFGASADLNTNRQAKRIVDLYKKYKTEPVKFVLVDVDKANTPALRSLVKTYYAGYIPGQVILDKQAKPKWNHTGEVDESVMATQLDKAL